MEHTLTRRGVLKGAGATAGAVAATGTATAQSNPTPQFNRTVNAVSDLGMDPNGNDPIDGALQSAHSRGTLIQFPPGEYRVNSPRVISGSTSQWGIQGLGSSRTDVVFTFPNANNGYWFIEQDGGRNVLLDNFTLDSDNKLVGIRIRTRDGGIIRDVEWAGFLPERHGYPGQLLDAGCLDTDGVNRVIRTVMGRGGSFIHGHSWATGRTGISGIRFYPGRHEGETILQNIQIHQLSSNGVRSTKPSGVVTVRGGYFKNCHLSHLRIHAGDHPSKRSSVSGARMVIDHDDHLPMTGEWNEHGCNAVMLDSTGRGYGQATYANCDIICRNVETPDGWGLIRCNNTGNSNPGGGVFRNCRIVNDTQLPTVWLDSREAGSRTPQWLFTNCDIWVTAERQRQAAAFVLRGNWDGSVIQDSVIHAPNGNVNGIYVGDSDISIENTIIDVSGQQIVASGAGIATSGVQNQIPDGYVPESRADQTGAAIPSGGSAIAGGISQTVFMVIITTLGIVAGVVVVGLLLLVLAFQWLMDW